MEDGQKTNDFSIRQCCIVTNLTHIDLDKMVIQLEERKCIEKWAYIIHDKDVYTSEDEKKNPDKKEGELKEKHIHLMLKFTSPQKARLVVKWFDLPINMLSKIKGKWMTALIYLTHGNNPEKAQYDFEDVKCNFDYEDAIDINQINTTSSRKIREKEIIELINSEVVREYNKHDYITPEEYNIHNRAIKNTFTYVEDRLKNEKGNRNMKVLYINGESGTGKTTYAKKIAEDKNLSYFVSSSSNDLLDGYEGQDCVILDDLRASSLAFPDLLKLLDNHTSSSVKSRFKNKHLAYCKMIIITSTLNLDLFLKSLKENENEDPIQLKRRVSLLINLRREDMDLYSYDKRVNKHIIYASELESPVVEYIKNNEEEQEKVNEELMDLVGASSLKKFQKSNVVGF